MLNVHLLFLNSVLNLFISVQPQVEVKSFPAEPIMALASNNEGTYIIGGGFSGDIYLWEVKFSLFSKSKKNVCCGIDI